jgi:monoamine oxidase
MYSMQDVIIIGAGAAGLAAAELLAARQLDILLLEARHRTGGRCWSVEHHASPVALELGAEFVHGAATETEALAARAGVLICDVAGDDWRPERDGLRRQHGFWERIGRVFAHIPADEDGEDMSFAEFLGRRPGGARMAEERELARSFVQGFHAADLERASVRAVAEAGNPGEDESVSRHGRTTGGYTALLAPLHRAASHRIRFGEVVHAIRWERRHAMVETQHATFEARTVIVTVPLGVLQSGGVRIEPMPASLRRGMEGLAMGHVARVTLLFESRFWEDDVVPGVPAGESLASLSFLHTPDSPFNIWWTLAPLRAPVMVGWSGGPPAAAMYGEGDVARQAVSALARALGMSRRRVDSRLEATFTHDWHGDAFSGGAYSYAVVGGAGASAALSRSAGGTLFMAGEATAGAHGGTVEGALRSGQRAARQVLRALGDA